MTSKLISFAEAINEAILIAMKKDKKVICYGLGVSDPKEVFGTTAGLKERFGENRVFDIPCSENAITGIGVGVSLMGYKPVMTHQRLDFFLLAMDQLVNSAAKWHYMFGSQISVPITIRLIIGRGWGQGPTHSQNLQSWFAHIPGLKVVCPSNAVEAKGLLLKSIFDPNPVIFLEHRWLHNSKSYVESGYYEDEIGIGKVVFEGKDITIVTNSYMVSECKDAIKFLNEKFSISCELINLLSLKPLDLEKIKRSFLKTNRLLCVETSSISFSVSSEIISYLTNVLKLKNEMILKKIGLPDIPEPTSYGLTKNFYINADNVINKVLSIFDLPIMSEPILRKQTHHDIPGEWFKGPF